MVSGFGVSVWFFQSGSPDQNTIWFHAPLLYTVAPYKSSKLTAGIPQITASTARRRRGGGECARRLRTVSE